MADANKKVNIAISTKADTAGADKVAKSMQSIATTTTVASSQVTKGANNMAFAVGNVGNQLQDIAVQAQSGTSAVTILAQQGPQLLSGFGPQGAIAGAVLALGALILSSMIKSTDAAKKAAQDAWEAADEFAKKTEEAYKKAGGEAADTFIAKSERIAELTRQSADQEIDLANQQRERIKAQGDLIKSQEDLAIASVKYLQATGQISDAEERIAEIQGKAREAQKENAVADIEASTAAAQIKYKAAQTLYEDARNEKTRIQEEIDALQQRQQTLNREANISRSSDKGMVAAGAQKAGYESAATSRLESQLAELEGAIANLQKESKKAPEKIDKALNAVYATAQEFDNAQKGAAAQIQELETKFNITESTQALNAGVANITEGVRTLKEDVAKLEPVNAQQQEAKNTIQAALADGKLTADEMLKVGAALQVLLGTIKAGQEGNITTIQEMQKVMNALIASNNSLVEESRRQAGIIKSLPAVTR
jgi:predicted  nucleic acid-binding Zn-ribbon protein